MQEEAGRQAWDGVGAAEVGGAIPGEQSVYCQGGFGYNECFVFLL